MEFVNVSMATILSMGNVPFVQMAPFTIQQLLNVIQYVLPIKYTQMDFANVLKDSTK